MTRTIVQLGNSNCTSCLNAMADHLRAHTLVRRVQLNQAAGCLVVDHDRDDVAAMIAEIAHDVRGWELAGNGEVVMVELDVHEELQCRWMRWILEADADPSVDLSRHARPVS